MKEDKEVGDSFFKGWMKDSKSIILKILKFYLLVFKNPISKTIFFILLGLLEYKILIKLWELYGLERVFLIAVIYRYGLVSNLMKVQKNVKS